MSMQKSEDGQFVRVTLTLPEQTGKYLKMLAETGLFGAHAQGVAESFVYAGLREALQKDPKGQKR